VIARASLGALVLAFAATVVASAQTPSPTLSNSAGVIIVRQPDDAASLTGVDLFVRAGLDRQTLAQNGLAALTAQSILETPVTIGTSGTTLPLETAAAAMGGSVSFDVGGRSVRFYVEGGSGGSGALVAVFAQALGTPAFDATTLHAARLALGRKIAQTEQVPLLVGLEMLDRQFFTDANAGLPQDGTATSLAQFVSADVRGFYVRNYRRGGAVVSAVGAPAILASGILERLAGVLPAGSSSAIVAKVPALRGASREMIAHRDIGAPWMVAQFPAPAFGSKNFGAMLVLAELMNRGLAEAAQVPNVISRTISENAVGSIYNFDQRPANLVIYVDGGLGDASSTFSNTLAFVKVIDMVKLTGSFGEFKALAQGDYIANATRLSDRAMLAGEFAMDGGSADYLNGALAAIAAVTPADVQRVARTYLGNPVIALIVPREAGSQ
jgi:zinc protease